MRSHQPRPSGDQEQGPAGQRYRIALIAPSGSPIAEPYDGGLQAYVATLTYALRERGHDVTLFAAPGSDPALAAVDLDLDLAWLSEAARRDVSMAADAVVAEHHAYLSLALRLARRAEFDVVHNHSLHYLPIAMADAIAAPVLTTLHTPPTPWLESAVRASPPGASRFVAVSQHTAQQWRQIAEQITVIPNGIDTDLWRAGPGGGPLVWSGRIAPEKGLHLAIEAARRAGRELDVAGPVVDRAYFERDVRPLLGGPVRYVGHVDQRRLGALVRSASAALVTPDWDEPYGLVVAEALSSGTPVVAFARGGIPEIVDTSCALLVAPGDVDGLVSAIAQVPTLDRAAARRRAVRRCSMGAMIDRYERLLDELVLDAAA